MNITSLEDSQLKVVTNDLKMMVTDKMIYTSEFSKELDLHAYVRCDIKEDDKCYTMSNSTSDGCKEEYEAFDLKYDDPLYYDDGPNDYECPYDGVKDCKLYCNSTQGLCYVFESEGYLIQVKGENWNYTYTYYKNDVKVEDFVFMRCDGNETSAPADICPAPAPTSSSASIVKAACALVIAAVVVALF